MNHYKLLLAGIVILFALCSACALDALVGKAVADTLSKPGSNVVFTGDDDPKLVADALPFAIKFYESVLAMSPGHRGMELSVGSMYIMYANAFVAAPAAFLPADRFEEKDTAYKRAKKLYLRGNKLLGASLDRVYPGFKAVFESASSASALNAVLVKVVKEDAAVLYWFAASWFGAASLDNLDTALGVKLPMAKLVMDRAYVLQPDFMNGMIDDFYVMFYASMPEGLGKDPAKVALHFAESLKKSKGKSAGPYMSYAESVFIPAQNRKEFEEYMAKVLAVDPYADQENTLVNVITQEKAHKYLSMLDEIFW